MPHEMSWGDIYFSPLVLVLILALIATWITVVILNKVKLSRFIAFPSLTFLAILVLYVIAIDHFYLRF
ncbi:MULTISPECIES: DUF1656 domain-containing protein [Vibrio]|jgi:hypothetical protein|uniref:DUF1656 domain-containing protein n=2 Tax=Vibrio TaxID=662 RepID=A0ABW7IJ60_9VIBR|nr:MULTISPECIES: DUF1656 domain-containing protein [Vibrio]KFA97018.1 hypothetical protein HW45_17170 [Vibrio sp. ER1A]MCG9626052.1 DUF1656 domain-containing protein [Vibrio mediterranei]MCY9871401.1 DUF1656 domain-containing protein [Vibrio barjaei]NOI21847.1 DUF1656 domain-containing protein [Vibrio mediterranei]OIN27854.1 hypothetical protein AWH66_2010920 [Vibrio barjaei]